jgi:hypothetical protein
VQALAAAPPVQNVVLVMSDGLRWQEVFRGAEACSSTRNAAASTTPTRSAKPSGATHPTPAAALLFLWNTIAPPGAGLRQPRRRLRSLGHQRAQLLLPRLQRNPHRLPDPPFRGNDKIPTRTSQFSMAPRPRRLRRTRRRLRLLGRLPFIFNAPRAGFLVNAGYDPLTAWNDPGLALLNRLRAETRVWPDEASTPSSSTPPWPT